LNDLKSVMLRISDLSPINDYTRFTQKYVTDKPVIIKPTYIGVTLKNKSAIWPLVEVESISSEDVIEIDGRYFRRYNLATSFWNEYTNDKGEIEHWVYLESAFNITYVVSRKLDLYGSYVYNVVNKVHSYELE
jgi:hypothetical protein